MSAATEETEADENASQSVSDKANLFAEITLADDGTLLATELDIPGETTTLTFQRANPTNVLFVNETDEERRLVLEYAVRAENAETDELEAVPAQQCTPLVEEGGSQLMTFYDRPPVRGLRPVSSSSCRGSRTRRSR